MKKLNERQMKQIRAGGLSAAAWAAIVAGISFLAGLLDGYTRPYSCR